jgi:hypothetical protein
MSLAKSQIGRAGELLVQYRLLLLGVDSAPMSTDTGVDLVAYSPVSKQPSTIQVKTNLRPKPGGGKGKPALDWWIPAESPAALIALVDLLEERLWMFNTTEIATLAQQKSSDRYHLYMYTDPTAAPSKADRLTHAYEFQTYLLENRAHLLFGVSRLRGKAMAALP